MLVRGRRDLKTSHVPRRKTCIHVDENRAFLPLELVMALLIVVPVLAVIAFKLIVGIWP
ncbi:MAG TPA: hypothetical protein VL175_21565 [Pirellulales bacterium]|jgi:hypothetical protein|nr:hypothetical protein [Pirellulales bacterium]